MMQKYLKQRSMNMKKKLMAVAAAVGIGIGLAAWQPAEAQGMGCGMAMEAGMIGGPMPGQGRLSEKEIQARQKFAADNTELRKKMMTKRAEYEAVMAGSNPDEKKAAALSGELFDLREQMQQKAKEAGISMTCGSSCGMGAGPGKTGGKGAAGHRHQQPRP